MSGMDLDVSARATSQFIEVIRSVVTREKIV